LTPSAFDRAVKSKRLSARVVHLPRKVRGRVQDPPEAQGPTAKGTPSLHEIVKQLGRGFSGISKAIPGRSLPRTQRSERLNLNPTAGSSSGRSARSAWRARAPGGTTSSLSGCGAASSTSKVYLRAYDNVSEPRASIGRYLDFYNRRRPHSSLDDTTPDHAYFTPLPFRAAA
jgi:Integrase core domain